MIKWLRERIRDIERLSSRSLNPLSRYGVRYYSQGKQDGYLRVIFSMIGIDSGTAVEIGAWDGIRFSNTRNLLENGWVCGYIEANSEKFEDLQRNIKGYSASAVNGRATLEPGERLDDLIDQLELPRELTLLCIDIDGNDFWVWKSLERHRPLVICIEYNAYVDPMSVKTLLYDKDGSWQGDFNYGASAGALYALGKKKGYTLVGFEPGLDLFFVRDDVWAGSGLEAVPLGAVPRGITFNFLRGRGIPDRMVDVKI